MSGGYFRRKQYEMQIIAEEIESLIDNNGSGEKDAYGNLLHDHYSDETIAEFRKSVEVLRKAFVYAHRIDWLVSGDDGEDSFNVQLKDELAEHTPPCRVVVNDLYIAHGTNHDKVWIGETHGGEGGEFAKDKFYEVLRKFYAENF